MPFAPTAGVVLLQAVCTAVGALPALLMQWSLPEDQGVAIGAAPVAALGVFGLTTVGGVIARRWTKGGVWRQVGVGSAVGSFAFVAALGVVIAVSSGHAWVFLAAIPTMLLGALLGGGGGVTGASLARRPDES